MLRGRAGFRGEAGFRCGSARRAPCVRCSSSWDGSPSGRWLTHATVPAKAASAEARTLTSVRRNLGPRFLVPTSHEPQASQAPIEDDVLVRSSEDAGEYPRGPRSRLHVGQVPPLRQPLYARLHAAAGARAPAAGRGRRYSSRSPAAASRSRPNRSLSRPTENPGRSGSDLVPPDSSQSRRSRDFLHLDASLVQLKTNSFQLKTGSLGPHPAPPTGG